jgi:phage terminase small subunit
VAGGKLTDKQQRFVEEYLVDLNASAAARRAGYSEKTAGAIGDENLKKPEIAAAVQAAMDERSQRTEISADYVLTTIRETIERCRQAKPVMDRKGEPVMVELPDGDLAPAYTFDSNAVLRGAELLGKHLQLFNDKIDHSGTITVKIVNL